MSKGCLLFQEQRSRSNRTFRSPSEIPPVSEGSFARTLIFRATTITARELSVTIEDAGPDQKLEPFPRSHLVQAIQGAPMSLEQLRPCRHRPVCARFSAFDAVLHSIHRRIWRNQPHSKRCPHNPLSQAWPSPLCAACANRKHSSSLLLPQPIAVVSLRQDCCLL